MRNGKFNNKAMETNRNLKQFFIEKNIFLVDYTKTFHPRNIVKVSCLSISQELQF